MSASPRHRRKAGVLTAGLLGSALGILSLAQPASAQQDQGQGGNQGQNQGQGQGQGQGGGRRGGGGGGGFDPAQFRQRMEERMKQALGASDEEWTVLQPKIEKVMTAQRQSSGGRGMGMLFGGGRRGGPDGGPGGQGGPGGPGGPGGGRGPGGPPDDSPVAVKARELQQSIEGNAGADEIKTKLTALREARAKAREQLTQAQGELKELLTAKQEAALVVMGMLE